MTPARRGGSWLIVLAAGCEIRDGRASVRNNCFEMRVRRVLCSPGDRKYVVRAIIKCPYEYGNDEPTVQGREALT